MVEKTAVMFPGQGKLYHGMGKEAFSNSEAAQAVFEDASVVARVNMARVCFGNLSDKLPEHPQMALTTTSLADYEYRLENGLPEGDLFLGMSAGEMGALTAAKAFASRQDAFTAVKSREEAMIKAGQSRPGRMVAVLGITKEQGKILAERAKASFAGRIALNHINISGDLHVHERVEQAASWLSDNGVIKRFKAIPLPKDVPPAHSELQEPAIEEFLELLNLLREYQRIISPNEKFLSNTSETFYDVDSLIKYVVNQLTNDIDLPDQLEKAHSELGITNFVEVEPGDAWTKAVQNHFPGAVVLQKHFGRVVRVEKVPKILEPVA